MQTTVDLATSQQGGFDLAVAPASDLKGSVAPDLSGVVADTKWVMGYWAGYENSLYPVSAIYWAGLSHVAVAFYLPNSDGTLDKTLFQGNATQGQALAKAVVDAAHANGKKAIISIGGADTRAGFVGAVDNHRAAFVAAIVALLADPGFDGIDLDWEPVDFASDGARIKALVDDLRAAAPGTILTMPIFPQNPNIPDDLSLYATFIGKLDQANLMTYGMAGAYSGWKSWHSSALYYSGDAAAPTSVKGSVDAYVAAGVPKQKLGVGAGFYGLCYSAGVTGPLQALNGSLIVANDGTMSYKNIVDSYESLGTATKNYDASAKVPWLALSNATNPQGCRYVTYENPQSIADKSAYVKSEGLGGAIIWTINQGYFPSAGTTAAKHPLLEAFRLGLLQ